LYAEQWLKKPENLGKKPEDFDRHWTDDLTKAGQKVCLDIYISSYSTHIILGGQEASTRGKHKGKGKGKEK